MTDSDRSVTLTRLGKASFRVTNPRGGTLALGEGVSSDFSPVELMLAAIAGCSAIDVDYLVGKRVDPESFDVAVRADKIRDELGNRLANIRVTFDLTFPDDEDGHGARQVLPRAVSQSHDRLCTVARTIVVGTPIEFDTT